ncbi:hypothetical protein LTS14_003550 [Recurvomyces mirabilis]|uniref:uncharacterized protein n=1 Tax=Recurvomyces mirabilis TaxID=574656 RepID=UPI002DDE9A70|nr:hypothetical protein LTS14_003550 [Recurvomyces mirabilis]
MPPPSTTTLKRSHHTSDPSDRQPTTTAPTPQRLVNLVLQRLATALEDMAGRGPSLTDILMSTTRTVQQSMTSRKRPLSPPEFKTLAEIQRDADLGRLAGEEEENTARDTPVEDSGAGEPDVEWSKWLKQ